MGSYTSSIGFIIQKEEGTSSPPWEMISQTLLNTHSVDHIYSLVTPFYPPNFLLEKIKTRIETDLGLPLERVQAIAFSTQGLEWDSIKEAVLKLGFGRILFLGSVDEYQQTNSVLDLFQPRQDRYINEAEIISIIPNAKVTGKENDPVILVTKTKTIDIVTAIKQFPDLTEKDQQYIIRRWNSHKPMFLAEIHKLTPALAKLIASWDGNTLWLNVAQNISVETTQTLATWKGHQLDLRNMQTLSGDAAQALAAWQGNILNLGGVQTLSKRAAKTLAAWQGNILDLGGVQTLSKGAAQALASWSGEVLKLNNIQTLSEQTAQALASWEGERLFLNNIRTLTRKDAQFLASWGGKGLYLAGIQTLSGEVAQALTSRNRLSLSIGSKKVLSEKVAQILASWRGESLHLNGIQTLIACQKSFRFWRGFC